MTCPELKKESEWESDPLQNQMANKYNVLIHNNVLIKLMFFVL